MLHPIKSLLEQWEACQVPPDLMVNEGDVSIAEIILMTNNEDDEYTSTFVPKNWMEAEKRSTELFAPKDHSAGDVFKEHRDVAILAPKLWIAAANECEEFFSLRKTSLMKHYVESILFKWP